MPSLHTNIGAKRAREARSGAELDETGPLTDLIGAAQQRAGLFVGSFPAEFAGAVLRRAGKELIVVNAAHPPVRRRFTLAHELGHICCGHDSRTMIDTVEMLSGGDTSNVEVQANAFAAEFLVPKAALAARDPEPSLEELVRLANDYGVSAIMMLFRFKTVTEIPEGRASRLQQEIDDGDHHRLFEHLGLTPFADALSDLTDDELPYVSPSLNDSALGAALAGAASIEAAARSAGTTPRRLIQAIS